MSCGIREGLVCKEHAYQGGNRCCSKARTQSSTVAARSAAPSQEPSRARARACFLAGRTPEKLERVAADIRGAGGTADVAQVDALDERMVDEHADAVVAAAGSLDISFNLITSRRRAGHADGRDGRRGLPAPGRHGGAHAVRHLACRGASHGPRRRRRHPHLRRRGRSAPRLPPRRPADGLSRDGGYAPPALDGARRCRRAGGDSADRAGSPRASRRASRGANGSSRASRTRRILGRAATLEDVGNVAAFVASDRARTMTAATANVSCGALSIRCASASCR